MVFSGLHDFTSVAEFEDSWSKQLSDATLPFYLKLREIKKQCLLEKKRKNKKTIGHSFAFFPGSHKQEKEDLGHHGQIIVFYGWCLPQKSLNNSFWRNHSCEAWCY